MNSRHSILLFLIWLLTLAAYSQRPLYFKKVGDQIDFFSSKVLFAVQENKGSLITGSFDNINRTNGSQFYPVKDSTNQITGRFKAIAELNADSFLLGSEYGLGLINAGKIKVLKPGISVFALSKKINKAIFVGTDAGLCKWQDGKLDSIPGSPKDKITSFCNDSNGNLYFSASTNVYQYSSGKIALVYSHSNPVALLYYNKKNKKIYFSADALYELDNKNACLIQKFTSAITQITDDKNGDAFICANNLFRLKNSRVDTLISFINNIVPPHIMSVLYDKNERLWLFDYFATFVEYDLAVKIDEPDDCESIEFIQKKTDSSFRMLYTNLSHRVQVMSVNGKVDPVYDHFRLKDTNSLNNDITGGIIFTSDYEFYRGVYNWGYEYFGNGIAYKVFIKDNANPRKLYLASDKKQVWMESALGPVLLNKNSYKIYGNPLDNNGKEIKIQRILPDPINNWLWIGTTKGNFGYLDINTGKYTLLDSIWNIHPSNTIENLMVNFIYTDKQKNIWFIIPEKGIYKVTRNGNNPANFSCTLWIGSPDQRTYCVDNNGNLWGNNHFTLKIYKADSTGSLQKPEVFRIINIGKGLENSPFHLSTFWFAFESPADKMIVRSLTKIYSYDINSLFTPQPLLNPIVISNMYLRRESVNWEAEGFKVDINGVPISPTFRYSQNDLGFDFGTLNSINNNIFYRFRLLGDDSSWHKLNTTSVYFNNLDYGKYSLELQYSFNGIEWSDTVVYKFTIQTPWWATSWFLSIAITALLTLIFLYIRLRLSGMRKKKSILEKEVRERTLELSSTIERLEASHKQNDMLISVLAHDIKGPARFIADVSENLHEMWPVFNEKEKTYLAAEIKKATKALFAFLTNFLSWIKLKNEKKVALNNVQVMPLLKRICDYQYNSGNPNENKITLLAPDDLFVTTNEKILEIILHNILDNACKYTKKGTIYFEAKKMGDKTIFSCTDNGIGINSEKINMLLLAEDIDSPDYYNSFKLGYVFIRDLSKIINAKIEIKSELEKGTTVSITIENNKSA